MRILTIFFIFLYCESFGQKQGDIWYFGNYAGVDFNTGSPTPLLNGQITISQAHNEGSSAISDSSGSILFYSDGMTVWNKNHQVMQNGTGLLGNFSSTQSSIIVPDQSNPNKYFYLFTVSSGYCCIGSISDGLRYSKVDMCLDSSRGGIIPTEKNIKLVDTVAEKISVTRHSNGADYWILTHKFYSNEFWALHLSSNGITDTVISAIGSYHNGAIGGSQGQLKFSPNGQRVAIGASNGLNLLEIFDFNNSTGIISNYQPLYKPNNDQASIYGVEFSQDNSKLYASGVSSVGSMYSFLAQYDLSAGGGSLSAINASMNEIYHNTSGSIGGRGLQIGPDNKIYWISLSNPGTLATINNPNILSSGSNYQDQSISLAGRQGSFSLPSFIAGFDYPNGLIQCDQTTGISKNIMNNIWSIFPNPFSQYATLKFQNAAYEKYNLSVYNYFGNYCFSISNITTGEVKIERDILNDGFYFFKLRTNNNLVIATGKFIVK